MYIHLTVCKQMTDVKLLMLYSNLTMCKKKQKSNELRLISKCYQQIVFKNGWYDIKAIPTKSYISNIYMYKVDLALNNL